MQGLRVAPVVVDRPQVTHSNERHEPGKLVGTAAVCEGMQEPAKTKADGEGREHIAYSTGNPGVADQCGAESDVRVALRPLPTPTCKRSSTPGQGCRPTCGKRSWPGQGVTGWQIAII